MLIDPFKQCLVKLTLDWSDQRHIHRDLLDCDLMQPVQLPAQLGSHILWVDESGLLREPFIYPQFKLMDTNGNCPLTGYGLITAWNYDHRIVVPECEIDIPTLPVIFEPWERRINPDLCIDQLLRCYYDR